MRQDKFNCVALLLISEQPKDPGKKFPKTWGEAVI